MKKFKFLTKYSLNKRIRSKAFLISNIFVLILVVLIANISSILTLFSNADENLETNVGIVLIEDAFNSFDVEGSFNTYYAAYGLSSSYSVLIYDDLDIAKGLFTSEDLKVLLVVSEENSNFSVDYYGSDLRAQGVVTTIFNQVSLDYQNISISTPHYEFLSLIEEEETYQNEIAVVMSMVMLVPMFFLIVMGTQFLGVDIVEEKSSKAIEVIISSVPTRHHYLSKIASNFLFILIQVMLMIIYGIIGFGVNKIVFQALITTTPSINLNDIFSMVLVAVPNFWAITIVSLIVLIGGSVLYLVIGALFASMASNQEDYQQFQSPLMITLVLGFYMVTFAPALGSSAKAFLTVVTFIPIFTPMVLPYTMIAGYVSLGWGVLAGVICFIFIYLLAKITDPIYKVSILNYDQSKFLTRIKNNFSKAFYKEKK